MENYAIIYLKFKHSNFYFIFIYFDKKEKFYLHLFLNAWLDKKNLYHDEKALQ